MKSPKAVLTTVLPNSHLLMIADSDAKQTFQFNHSSERIIALLWDLQDMKLSEDDVEILITKKFKGLENVFSYDLSLFIAWDGMCTQRSMWSYFAYLSHRWSIDCCDAHWCFTTRTWTNPSSTPSNLGNIVCFMPEEKQKESSRHKNNVFLTSL